MASLFEIDNRDLNEYECYFIEEMEALELLKQDYSQRLDHEEIERFSRWKQTVEGEIRENDNSIELLKNEISTCKMFDFKKKKELNQELKKREEKLLLSHKELDNTEIVKKNIHHIAYIGKNEFERRCQNYLRAFKKRVLAKQNQDFYTVITLEDKIEEILKGTEGHLLTAEDLVQEMKKTVPDYYKILKTLQSSEDSIIREHGWNFLTFLTDLMDLGRVGYFTGAHEKPYLRYYYLTGLGNERIKPMDIDKLFSLDVRKDAAEIIAIDEEKKLGDGFVSFMRKASSKYKLDGWYDSMLKNFNRYVQEGTLASMQRVLSAKSAMDNSRKLSPAIVGGLVNGIMGPIAGLAVAYSINNDNQRKNSQRIIDEANRERFQWIQESNESTADYILHKIRLLEYYVICKEKGDLPIISFEEISGENPIYVPFI